MMHIQLNPVSHNYNGEMHYLIYLKFWKFKLCTIEIGISNNQLAGVVLNPSDTYPNEPEYKWTNNTKPEEPK